MHHLSLPGLQAAVLATCAIVLYLVPPGFLMAGLCNLADFWTLSLGEKLCWSVALSFPVSIVLAVVTGHYLGAGSSNPVFLLVAAASVLQAVVQSRKGRLLFGKPSRGSILLMLALLATVLLSLCITTAVRVNGHLEEGAFTNDWYIRVPLQWEAGLAGVPPNNPLFTLDGQNPVMHYHYFIYVLFAQPMRLFHLGPRAVLEASAVWASVGFFAVGWLMLKYLAMPSAGELFAWPGSRFRPRVRQLALLFCGISLVDGLNIVPNVVALLLGGRLFHTVFAWSNEGTAAWPGTVAFGPHHMVGCICALLGYLLLSFRSNVSRSAVAVHSVLAGICFAAVLGTSAFVAMAGVLAAIVFGGDALLRRRWITAASVTASLVLALLLDSFFLIATFFHRATAQGAGTIAAQAAPVHSLKLVLWEWHEAYGIVGELLGRVFHVAMPHGIRGYLLVPPMLVLLYAIHYGMYAFMLWYRARYDLRKGLPPSQQRRAMWILFFTLSALSLFVSSAPMQHGTNDMGRNIVNMARIVLIVWACPLVAAAWNRDKHGPALPTRTKVAFALATACGVLGLASCAWDVAVQRLYLPLVDYGVVRSRDPFLFSPGIGVSYAELSDAWQQIDRTLPPSAIVQHNPDGVLQRPALLYMNRRVAAGDVECESTFGGDPVVCIARNSLPLLALFAQPEQGGLQKAPDPTPEAFSETCASLRLSALIATDFDPVWSLHNSWVWHEPALYAGRRVRVLRCPAGIAVNTR